MLYACRFSLWGGAELTGLARMSHLVREGEKGQEKVLTFPPIEDVLKTPWSSLKDRFPISRVFVSGQCTWSSG